MNFVLTLIIVFLVFPLMSFAQEKQMPIDRVDEMQKLESLSNKLDQVKNIAESITKEKYYKCVKAFGNHSFCKCLADNLPVVTTFENYIVIVTSSRNELNYNNLSSEDKKIVDVTYKARETCVNVISPKKAKTK